MGEREETRILIVDDESEMRRQLRKYLELEFWDSAFSEAADGEEALERAQESEPTVIISDINMPRMNGLELLQKMKDTSPHTQVIICTGRDDPDSSINALKYGASDYLMKPLNMEEVSVAIHRGIERHWTSSQLSKHRERLEQLVEKRTESLLRLNETLRKEKEINRELEAQFLQAQKMEAIGVMAGGIAHDFNNILSAIIGYTDMTIERLEENSRERKNLGEVLKAGMRAKSLVRQILSFSRQEEQNRFCEKVHHIVSDSIEMLRATIPSTVKIVTDIDTNSGSAMVDKTQIEQVVMNLCVNAGHAMQKKGGDLEISVKAVTVDEQTAAGNPKLHIGAYITISVADTGTGMDEATIKKIFEPFFTTKEVGQGSGLGLSAVHGIVMSHDGAINVESTPGKGTTFTVYLPTVKPPQEEKQTSQTSDKAPIGDESILLVDDERPLAEMWSMALTDFGYNVEFFTNPKEALEAFRNNPDKYDLVITDHTMPEMTGSALASEMLVIRPDIPMLLCSGYSNLITPELAKEIGFRQYIMKPVIGQELATAVRNTLDLTHLDERT